MSFEWTAQPLSIQSIASQFTLPVVIRSAPGFRGPSRPIVLHSISRITFAFGRALKARQGTKTAYQSYRPTGSEIVAVPLHYPGYFECLSPSSRGPQDGIVPEKSIPLIVERMQIDHRPQAFYLTAPMRVYTLETNNDGKIHRSWHPIEAHQVILFEKLLNVEYTPTEQDNLTPDDYTLSWWFCFGKHLLNRHEQAIKCLVKDEHVCYISSSSTEEVSLIPVGQRGSTNAYKLQTIQNLVEQFTLPLNIKAAQLPGSYTYKDFNGYLQLLGSRTEELAICASLSSNNIAAISTNTPLKFVVAPFPSSQLSDLLSRCHLFTKSFEKQIRRLLISSSDPSTRRSRSRFPKKQAAINQKRSHSTAEDVNKPGDQTTSDEGYRSGSSRRNQPTIQRTISMDVESSSKQKRLQRSLSTDSGQNSLAHPNQNTAKGKQLLPPPLPKKPPNFPYPSSSSSSSPTDDNRSHFLEDFDSSNADGAILIDNNNELFSAIAFGSRLT